MGRHAQALHAVRSDHDVGTQGGLTPRAADPRVRGSILDRGGGGDGRDQLYPVQAFTVRIVVTSYEIHNAPDEEDIFNYLDDLFSGAEELRRPEDCELLVGMVEEREFDIIPKKVLIKEE